MLHCSLSAFEELLDGFGYHLVTQSQLKDFGLYTIAPSPPLTRPHREHAATSHPDVPILT